MSVVRELVQVYNVDADRWSIFGLRKRRHLKTHYSLERASFFHSFLFCFSTGRYVCHHPILKQNQSYLIGGRNFNTIDEAVTFYRTSPLGDAMLTEQVRMSFRDRDTYKKATLSSFFKDWRGTLSCSIFYSLKRVNLMPV